jgi:hypothetical protein
MTNSHFRGISFGPSPASSITSSSLNKKKEIEKQDKKIKIGNFMETAFA